MKLAILLVLALPATAQTFDYLRTGNAEDVVTATRPGFVLMGGGADVAEAFQWMIERSGGGDFLVIRASGTDAYNPFVQRQGSVNSAATLIFRDRAASFDQQVIERILKAEALFLAGGDQWDYVRLWKDTPVAEAIQELIRRGTPVGGTSAGLAVLGQYYFSAKNGSVVSAEALSDPFHARVTLGACFLGIDALRGVITDSHFTQRTREGRLIAFLARIIRDGWTSKARGIGIDEATAVLMEPNGASRVVGRNAAHYYEVSEEPEKCEAREPLTVRPVKVTRVEAGQGFDVREWKGEGKAEVLEVTGGELRARP